MPGAALRRLVKATVFVFAALLASEFSGSRAAAHLAVGGRSLIVLCVSSTAVVIAQALESTHWPDGAMARTPFVVEQKIIGDAPAVGKQMELFGGAAPARYARGERALLFCTAGGGPVVAATATPRHRRPFDQAAPPSGEGFGSAWRAVQQAGGRLVLREDEDLDSGGAQALGQLCFAAKAERETPPGVEGTTNLQSTRVTDALVELLEIEVASLRLLAAVDLLDRLHHPESFSAAARTRLAKISLNDSIEPRVRALASRIVGGLDAAAARPADGGRAKSSTGASASTGEAEKK